MTKRNDRGSRGRIGRATNRLSPLPSPLSFSLICRFESNKSSVNLNRRPWSCLITLSGETSGFQSREFSFAVEGHISKSVSVPKAEPQDANTKENQHHVCPRREHRPTNLPDPLQDGLWILRKYFLLPCRLRIWSYVESPKGVSDRTVFSSPAVSQLHVRGRKFRSLPWSSSWIYRPAMALPSRAPPVNTQREAAGVWNGHFQIQSVEFSHTQDASRGQ